MSAGNFLRSRYQGDSPTEIYPIRVQPETLALVLDGITNAPPNDAINQSVSAKVSGGRRQFGVNARKVRIRFTGAPPAGYAVDRVITLPILSADMFDEISKGEVGTYLGAAVEVIGKTPEYIN